MGRVREVLTHWRTWETVAILSIFVFAVVTTAPYFFADLASRLNISPIVGYGIMAGSFLLALIAFIMSLIFATDPITEEPEQEL